jgi:hypothetical protein
MLKADIIFIRDFGEIRVVVRLGGVDDYEVFGWWENCLVARVEKWKCV